MNNLPVAADVNRLHSSRADARPLLAAELTLAAVREISEGWHHRPAPNTLRCIPVQTSALKPARRINPYLDYLLSVLPA